MAQTKILHRRIRSVKNAQQITKALEVVAASRMRRVVQLVEGSRKYGDLAASIMQRISNSPEIADNPLFVGSPDKPTLYLIFSSDRGQAGAFNSNIFHISLESLKTERNKAQIVAFGRKAARFFPRINEVEMVAAFEGVDDVPEANFFAPVMAIIQDKIYAGEIGRINLVYTQFISSLTQKPTNAQLVPITPSDDNQDKYVSEFEPDIEPVLDEAIRLYLEAKLMQAKIESAASEHAMRMVAMGNANRNAGDLVDDLTLELNATRQAAITQEIAEITGGAAAIAA